MPLFQYFFPDLISFLSYCQAQATVLEAIPRLHSMSIPTKRPEDFFAQMAKSDDHMKRVNRNLNTGTCISYE